MIPVLANSVKGTLRSRVKVVTDLVHPRCSCLVRSVHQSPICRPEPCAELLCQSQRLGIASYLLIQLLRPSERIVVQRLVWYDFFARFFRYWSTILPTKSEMLRPS